MSSPLTGQRASATDEGSIDLGAGFILSAVVDDPGIPFEFLIVDQADGPPMVYRIERRMDGGRAVAEFAGLAARG